MEFTPKKSLGQHFLNNARIPEQMAEAADVGADDTVLEIGPGTGVLTRALLQRGARVIAVEADPRAILALEASFPEEIGAGRLTLIHADMRTEPIAHLGVEAHHYKVVANIPYYLSGKLFRTFLETDTQPSTLVFLVQKEVAERITRDPKESLLSLGVKAFGDPRYVETVKRGNFTPAPRVDSAIIAVSHISHERLLGVDERFFFELLHSGFGSRRKQLLGNLSKSFPRALLSEVFLTLRISESVRAEDLGLELWFSLARTLLLHRTSTG